MFPQFVFTSSQMRKVDVIRRKGLVTRITSEYFIAVNMPISVCLHVGFLSKSLVTHVADKRLLSGMRTFVMFHCATVVGHVVALIAVEFVIGWITFRLLRIHMTSSCVQKQLTQSFKKLFTLPTSVDFNKVFFTHVLGKGVCVRIHGRARGTAICNTARLPPSESKQTVCVLNHTLCTIVCLCVWVIKRHLIWTDFYKLGSIKNRLVAKLNCTGKQINTLTNLYIFGRVVIGYCCHGA